MKEEDGGWRTADSDGSIEVVKVEKIQRKCRKRKQDNVHTTNTHERVSTRDHTNSQTSLMNVLFVPTHFNTLNTPIPLYLSCYKLIRMAQHLRGPSVHKICASMFPHQLKCDFETNTVHGLDDITKNQKKLRCGVCRQSEMGACFQCSYKKCTRAFHGSCGLVDGVQYDFDSGEAFVNSTARALPQPSSKLECMCSFCSTTEYILDN